MANARKPQGITEESFTKSLKEGGSLSEAFGMTDLDLELIAGLAAAFYQEGNLESALKILEGLTCLRPEKGDYWSALGAVLTRLERHEQAIPVLTAALEIDPKDTAALVNRGECYIGMADAEKAANDFETAIKLDRKQEDPAANRARQLAVGLQEFFEQCREAGLDTVEVDEEEE